MLWNLIPTKIHGLIDYMTAGMLVALPRVMGWSRKTTCLMDTAAATTVAYSLLTRYELGAVKALPMKGHLALDLIQGGTMLAAAGLMEDEDPEVRGTLAALGAFELAVTLTSQTHSPAEVAAQEAEYDHMFQTYQQTHRTPAGELSLDMASSMPQAGYPDLKLQEAEPELEAVPALGEGEAESGNAGGQAAAEPTESTGSGETAPKRAASTPRKRTTTSSTTKRRTSK